MQWARWHFLVCLCIWPCRRLAALLVFLVLRVLLLAKPICAVHDESSWVELSAGFGRLQFLDIALLSVLHLGVYCRFFQRCVALGCAGCFYAFVAGIVGFVLGVDALFCVISGCLVRNVFNGQRVGFGVDGTE